MKCIIVDDEPLAREGMKLNTKEVSSLNLMGCFGSAFEANDFLKGHDVDLMFLDIEMPNMSGLDFLKTLIHPPLVVLTTAYPQYALDSYELGVIDYLVKPIRIERFIKSVNKAEEIFRLKTSGKHELESIGDDFIFVKADRKFVKILFRDIKYIEGLKDYVIIHTIEKKIMTAMNVKTIDNHLPSDIFTRVNKSFVINVNAIKEIDSDFVIIGTNEIPIGRTFRDDFINNYVVKKLIKR